jgi:hypothetical protein
VALFSHWRAVARLAVLLEREGASVAELASRPGSTRLTPDATGPRRDRA